MNIFAPHQIAKVGHDDAPSGRGNRRRKCQKFAPAQPFGNIRREEELADDGGEENENDKVIKLQRAAQAASVSVL